MPIHKIKMSKERKLRIHKDCVRDIVPFNGLSNCYKIVRDDSYSVKGDFCKTEPITYNTRFNFNRLYKYMDYEGFIKTLKTGFLFKEPSLWSDPYESRFYNAKYNNINPCHTPKPVYAFCLTTGFETEANWKQYVGNNGLSSKAVRLSIDSNSFICLLNCYAERNRCKIYIGAVTYEYKEQEIDTIHMGKKSKSFWLSKFSLRNYLSLLLIKRPAFYNEKEIRVFVIPNNMSQIGCDGKLFIEPEMKWENIINEVCLCPESTEEELDYIKWLCEENKISCTVKKSSLKEKQAEISISPVEKAESFLLDVYDEI